MWKYIRKYKYQNAAVLGIIALINVGPFSAVCC